MTLPENSLQGIPTGPASDAMMFRDSDDPNIVWFKPLISVAGDEEQNFLFVVTQSGQDPQGNPISGCHANFTLKASEPSEVAALRTANPTVEFRQIPISHFTGGILRAEGKLIGQIISTPLGSDLFELAVGSNPMDPSSLIDTGRALSLYDSLRLNGSATLDLRFILRLPVGSSITLLLSTLQSLGRTFAAERYQVAYTVTVGQTTRLIFHHDDLATFNASQSEFQEFTALGNVNQRYPSIDRLFISRLTRQITVIPSRYVILRERGSCAAVCTAVVDSGSAAAGSKFQFAFTLVPDLSPIEVADLFADINSRADTRGCTLQIPNSFNLATGSTLATAFASSVQFGAGSGIPGTIALSLEIAEQLGGQPAVAAASALITQLRSVHEPFLTGSVTLKLDDVFPTRIDVPVLLSFKETHWGRAADERSAADEFSLTINEANLTVTLTSASIFDLFVDRVALVGPQQVIKVGVGQVVPKGGSISLPLAAGHSGLHALVDCELQIGTDALPVLDLFKFLQFKTVDVQDMQYLLAVNAGAVNFQARAIDRIEVAINLVNLPAILVPSLLILKERTADSTHALVPIVQAITELESTLLFTMHFLDPNRVPLRFARQNDFVQHPIFILNDADLAN